MIPHTVRPLRPRRTAHAVTPRPLTPNALTAVAWTPETSTAPGVLALPPVLAGESVQVLLMTDHGTYLADATVTHAAPAAADPATGSGTGWSLSADLAAPRATFALATTADRLTTPTADPAGFTDCAVGGGPGPAPARCPGCLATRDQPCRWAHRAHQHAAVTADTAAEGTARDPLTESCPGCNAEPGQPCRWSCLSWVTHPGHRDRESPDPTGEDTDEGGDQPTH